jgi:ribosomal protein S27AE
MFDPEKCPKCGKAIVVEHYDTGWRCVCSCGWYGVFHFDEPSRNPKGVAHSSPA